MRLQDRPEDMFHADHPWYTLAHRQKDRDFKGSTNLEEKHLTFPIPADHITFSEAADVFILLSFWGTFTFWVISVGQASVQRTGFKTLEALNEQTEGCKTELDCQKSLKPICVHAKHHVTPAVIPWLSSIRGSMNYWAIPALSTTTPPIEENKYSTCFHHSENNKIHIWKRFFPG